MRVARFLITSLVGEDLFYVVFRCFVFARWVAAASRLDSTSRASRLEPGAQNPRAERDQLWPIPTIVGKKMSRRG